MEVDKINAEWSKKVNQQVKEVGTIASLNVNRIKYATAGMPEHEFLENERNKLMNTEIGENLRSIKENLSEKQNEINEFAQLTNQRRETIEKITARIQKQINSNNSKLDDLKSELSNSQKEFRNAYSVKLREVREKIYGKDYKEYYGGSITGIPSEEFEKLNVQTKIKLRDELRAVEQAGRTVLSGSIVGNEKDLDAFFVKCKSFRLKRRNQEIRYKQRLIILKILI